VIEQVPNMSAEEVDEAVERAKQALPEWLEATPGERASCWLKLGRRHLRQRRELAQLESRNVGKPLMVSRDEMPFSADNLRFFAGAARILEGKSGRRVRQGLHVDDPAGADRDRRGHLPVELPADDGGLEDRAGLAAGNVQILKPAEQTPLSLLRFMELRQDVLPSGVLQVVTGDGVPTGQRLVEHPDIGLVSLTGDVATGS
jgi:acyl-CoA reductase-like NAD-dependent aldehyde dehydrogenase